VLLLQFTALITIIPLGQWNALRHGQYAYSRTHAALTAHAGPRTVSARQKPHGSSDLYGARVLLAATRDIEGGKRNRTTWSTVASRGRCPRHGVRVSEATSPAYSVGCRLMLRNSHDGCGTSDRRGPRLSRLCADTVAVASVTPGAGGPPAPHAVIDA